MLWFNFTLTLAPSRVCTCYNQVKLKIQFKIFSHRLLPLSPSPNSRVIVIIHELGLVDKGRRESTSEKNSNLNFILTYNICMYTAHVMNSHAMQLSMWFSLKLPS